MMDPPLPPPSSAHKTAVPKLRLMVSYGGHILPRANNKTLFYSGGDTRIISLPRTKLSLSSLFTHISNSLLNGSHAFSLKYQLPSHDLDSLISVSCHEDLLNMLDEYDRLSKLSPSSRIRFFLFHSNKDDVVSASINDDNNNEGTKCCGGGGGGVVDEGWIVDAVKVAGSNLGGVNNNNDGNCNNNNNSDAAETIVLESNSSFGSNSSSPNSPSNNNNNKGNGGCGGDDFKVVLPSLDSFGSDSSIPSPNFSQQGIIYHDASGFIDSKPVSANLINTESVACDRSPRSDILSPIQASSYMVSNPMDQLQQLFPPPPSPPAAAPHYIHHPPAQTNYVTQYYPSSIPIGSYAPMYQTFIQPQQPVPYHHNPQKPYPVYMMPIGQSQNMYDAYTPHALTTAPTIGTIQPQVHRPVMITSSMGYEGCEPIAPPPEYATKLCGPTPVTPPSMALPPLNHPTHPVSISPSENINCEFEDPIHAQIYKTQPSN